MRDSKFSLWNVVISRRLFVGCVLRFMGGNTDIPSFFWKGGIIELKCGKGNVIYRRKDERMRGMKKCVGWRISELGNEKGI